MCGANLPEPTKAAPELVIKVNYQGAQSTISIATQAPLMLNELHILTQPPFQQTSSRREPFARTLSPLLMISTSFSQGGKEQDKIQNLHLLLHPAADLSRVPQPVHPLPPLHRLSILRRLRLRYGEPQFIIRPLAFNETTSSQLLWRITPVLLVRCKVICTRQPRPSCKSVCQVIV